MAEKIREASARGEITRLTRLLDDGIKPLPDEHGRSALFIAAASGQLDASEILIKYGLDVNTPDNTGVTPLQKAAAEGHLEVVELLLKHGADVSRQDNVHGNSALHEACWRGYSRTVSVLAKALGTQRGPLHARNFSGFAPLHLACQNGHNQSCRELLLAGCNPDLQNNCGDTPLHTAARYGHAGVTRILISALCRVSDQNKNGDTALHIASAMGRRKLTRILLEANCDRTLRNKQNETAKDIARRKNLVEILEIINKAKAKSRSQSKTRSQDGVDAVSKSPLPRDSQLNASKRKDSKEHKESKDKEPKSKDLKEKVKEIKDKVKEFKEKDKKPKEKNKVHFESQRQWSPYGCHYYPDPESFPSPKLDSLPSDPLARGEQYYLDLAGNIRKGPVGVGYTCYCAPFFRHMEAKMKRDKAELKAHIEQAHERLDLKVAHLEKRTRGQISELTRHFVAEKARCEDKHAHMRRWLTRNGAGRHSERPAQPAHAQKRTAHGSGPVRARSVEDLLDERPADRSFEIPGETSGQRLGSLDNLDIPAIPRLSKSLKDLPLENGRVLRVLEVAPRLNETFDGVIGRNRSQDHAWMEETSRLEGPNRTEAEEDLELANSRRSVHEMIKRFQQIPGMHKGRRPKSELADSKSRASGSWNANDSESSEVDDPAPNKNAGLLGGSSQLVDQSAINLTGGNNYETIARMPYRSRSAVYSPTPFHHTMGAHGHDDAHNDSGYSTRMYGSSKGASPSLSGQLDCDVLMQSRNFSSREHLAALLEQPRVNTSLNASNVVHNGLNGHELTVFERSSDNMVINIGTASLV
ncbi:ankyrin repeat domain-containing protein 6 isoform X2 [Microplitis mediator]|nr:ankyrin repeat domain-containing protein 6 isoform X2 [Microplitis mediator]